MCDLLPGRIAYLTQRAFLLPPLVGFYLPQAWEFNLPFTVVAIHGYDPVAYFEQGAPKQGSSDFVHTWGGATWRFASQENLGVFAADPTGFAPQFGGYCAWAVAQNSLAEVDPEYWAVVDGKLYLNKNLEAHEKWREAQSESIATANQNWPELSAGLNTVAE